MLDLWAVHVEGPDDIIATKSLIDAEKLAAEINASQVKLIQSAPENERRFYPRVMALPVLWEGTAEDHEEALKEDW